MTNNKYNYTNKYNKLKDKKMLCNNKTEKSKELVFKSNSNVNEYDK